MSSPSLLASLLASLSPSQHPSWDVEENKKKLEQFLSESFSKNYSEDEIKNNLRLFKKASITDNDICEVMIKLKNHYFKLIEFAAEISAECVICESIYCKENCTSKNKK